MRSASTLARSRAAVFALALAAGGLGGGSGVCVGELLPGPTIDAVSAETKEEISVRFETGPAPIVETKECSGQVPGDPNACPGVSQAFEYLLEELDRSQRFSSRGLQFGASGGFYGDAYLFIENELHYPATIDFDATYRNFLFISSANSKVEVTVSDVEWGGSPLDLACTADVQMAGGPVVDLPVGATTLVDVPGAGGAVATVWTASCDGEALEVEGSLDFPAAARLTVEWGPISQTCTNDSQCPESAGFCVDGTCRTGVDNARCSNHFDCAEGLYCSGRTFRCQNGDAFDPCDIDADCPNANACVSFQCTEGDAGDLCFEDEDCNLSTAPFCVTPNPGFSGSCSEGLTNDFCVDDGDCAPGLTCILGGVNVCSG